MVLALVVASQTPWQAAHAERDLTSMAVPQTLIIAGDIPTARRGELLTCARRFYQFWNTGDEDLLREVISKDFVDHTLPRGRPQGPAGLATAAKALLAAVPDLEVVVTQQIVVGDRVVSNLRFTGRFTGVFEGVQGSGQPIDFIATDILEVRDARITDNWHLEDNLTFLRQIGLVSG